MDITLPICPCARLFIQTKNPMMSATGSSRLAQLSNQLLSGCLMVTSTLCSARSDLSDSSGKLSRTVVVNFEPSVSTPDTELEPLVTEMLFTLLALTAVTNSE